MTRPTLTVVGSGQPEPDDSAVKHAEEVGALLVAAAKAGDGFFVLIDGEDALATYSGDMLEMAATAEEVARDMKRRALGFSE